MLEGWLTEAALTFWRQVGDETAFPRDLESPALSGYALPCVPLPHLCVRAVEDWLHGVSGVYQFLCANRALRGCIVAARGTGVLFVCDGDPLSERRFTVAHEVAHFLLDYLLPRAKALRALGPTILPVLDGDRPPTETERIDAVLSHVPLGLYYRLLERAPQGGIAQGYVLQAEARADRLALELLAPFEAIRADLAVETPQSAFAFLHITNALLTGQYGLPERIAQGYAVWLQKRLYTPSAAEWLGF